MSLCAMKLNFMTWELLKYSDPFVIFLIAAVGGVFSPLTDHDQPSPKTRRKHFRNHLHGP